jgi:hypothetical protein
MTINIKQLLHLLIYNLIMYEIIKLKNYIFEKVFLLFLMIENHC